MLNVMTRLLTITTCVLSVAATVYGHATEQRPRNLEHNLNTAARWAIKTPTPVDHKTLNKTLVPLTFEPLPLGSVKPLGWMKDQLQLMVDGFPGHMHEFYRLITNATWFGGDQEYSFLNEAWPYWYNGAVALAYGLDDERLKNEVLRVTDYMLKHQFKDGWLGPESELKKRNFWGRYPFLLGLAQLADAEPKHTERIIEAMHRFVDLMHSMLKSDYQGYVLKDGDEFDEQWGRSRAADLILSLQWLYEKHPLNNSIHIHESMVYLYEKAYDWTYWYGDDVYLEGDMSLLPKNITDPLFPYIHGVNVGQGLKFGAVMHRLTHNHTMLLNAEKGVDLTFKHHGTPSGAVIGDEIQPGLSPVRGTELCSVVESMFSLTYLFQASGNGNLADRAELAAYNALPVMITKDWWGHQYIAQTNQAVSHRLENPPFWNVGPVGQRFGIELNGPCCTVNHPQGYPKFLSASFNRMGHNGLAHALLMPAEVRTILGQNNAVYIRCETQYPFHYELKYTIIADAPFNFAFRVPNWAKSLTVRLDDVEIEHIEADSTTHLVTNKVSAGNTSLIVKFASASTTRAVQRANDTVSIYNGALLYALSIAANYTSSRPENYPNETAPSLARDWTIEPLAGYKWNIAIDPTTIMTAASPAYPPPLPNPIWTPDAPPNRISVMACELAGWKLTSQEGGYAPEPPSSKDRRCVGQAFRVWLQPYGALKLHMAEFPIIDLRHGVNGIDTQVEQEL